MPIVFDEISGEVTPERSGEGAEQLQQPVPSHGTDPAELLHRELQLLFERERRLIAD